MKLSCAHVYNLLLDFLETALPADMHNSMRAHLAECPACTRMVRTYEQTRQLCHDVLCTDLPQGAADKLLTTLRDKIRPEAQVTPEAPNKDTNEPF
jgi:anti-sigma factor RsiW